MLAIQKNYLKELEEISQKLEELGIDTQKIQIVKNEIENLELIIPVIGAFDAGKSTLINSFLGKPILPTDITPETSLATELRYSEDEHIETVTKTDETEIFKIEQINFLTENAEKYKYMKIYLNNDNLKKAQPFILVDMPGFEAPFESHHLAITEYIARGIHFIVLLNAKSGTLNNSILKQLEFLQDAGKSFTFFLSKSDLINQSDLEEIKNHIKKELKNHLDIQTEIIPIGKDSGKELVNLLNQLQPEKLFKQAITHTLENLYLELIETLNTYTSTFNNNRQEIEEQIKLLKESVETIREKKEQELRRLKEDTNNVDIDEIVNDIENELTNNTPVFADYIVNNRLSDFQEDIIDIIKSNLFLKLRNYLEERSDAIASQFSSVILENSKISTSFSIDKEFLKRLTKHTEKLIKNAQNSLSKLTEKIQKNERVWKMITSTLAILTDILAPIIEIIIVFLPDILKGFLKQWQKKKIENHLLTSVYPKITRKLKIELSKQISEAEKLMTKEISEVFEQQLKEKQKEIAKALELKAKEKEDISKKIEKFETLRKEIEQFANQLAS